MKQYNKYLAGFSLIFAVTACNSGTDYDGGMVGLDSTTWTPIEVDTFQDQAAIIQDEIDQLREVEIVDSAIDLESFQNQFYIYFDHQFDFGWRYITANYEEYNADDSIAHTEVNRDFDLSTINAVTVEGDAYPIDFEGFAHSYQYVNGYHIYVTYVQREISEELHYYYVNAAFEVMKEGELASAGGDEGAWSYSYGEFSKDFSVYKSSYAGGEGLDTSDYSSDVIYFD